MLFASVEKDTPTTKLGFLFDQMTLLVLQA